MSDDQLGYDDQGQCEEGEDFQEWSIEVAEAFLAAGTDKEMLQVMREAFQVTEEEYSDREERMTVVDFNFGNALFCRDQGFDASQTAFVCSALFILLTDATNLTVDETCDFDVVRKQLVERLKMQFTESKVYGTVFDEEEVRVILDFVATTFLHPLRLLVRPFVFPRGQFLDEQTTRKVFAPVEAEPLAEFISEDARTVTRHEAVAIAESFMLSTQRSAEARCESLAARIKALEEELAV